MGIHWTSMSYIQTLSKETLEWQTTERSIDIETIIFDRLIWGKTGPQEFVLHCIAVT